MDPPRRAHTADSAPRRSSSSIARPPDPPRRLQPRPHRARIARGVLGSGPRFPAVLGAPVGARSARPPRLQAAPTLAPGAGSLATLGTGSPRVIGGPSPGHGDVPQGRAEAVLPDGRRAPGLPCGVSEGLLPSPWLGARGTVVRADCQRIHSPAVVSVRVPRCFPHAGDRRRVRHLPLAGRNLFRACLAGVCSLVLEYSPHLSLGLRGRCNRFCSPTNDPPCGLRLG